MLINWHIFQRGDVRVEGENDEWAVEGREINFKGGQDCRNS